jgi:hypothetical protein
MITETFHDPPKFAATEAGLPKSELLIASQICLSVSENASRPPVVRAQRG